MSVLSCQQPLPGVSVVVCVRNTPQPVGLFALTFQDKFSLFRLPPGVTKFPYRLLGAVSVGLALPPAWAAPAGVCEEQQCHSCSSGLSRCHGQ